jgi:hypothetical protein
MLATPQIIQTTAQAAAIIHLTVPRNEMMKVFGPAVGELWRLSPHKAWSPSVRSSRII